MDQHHTPAWTHLVTSMPSRRDVVRGFAGVGLGFAALRMSNAVAARKKRKRKNKKPKLKRNEFGCVNVGGFCKSSDQCCSGICQGKKGKRKCRAHDTGTCRQESLAVCQSPSPTGSSCNNRADCVCFRTTAGSSVCGEVFCGLEGCSECADCQKDADCVALGLPPGAVCAPVSEGVCAGICESGMACVLPCGEERPQPPE